MRRPVYRLSTCSLVSLVALASGDASAASGGPDAFGYRFVDQDDGAVYNYVDITMTGTSVISGDDSTGPIALGAPFEFYGVQYMNMVAATNGFLTSDPGAAFDTNNDCPMPATPGTGRGFRLNSLHDDLVTSVYYQYFTEVEAAAIGFPGEASGVSIVQWSGTHFGGGGAVDVETVLFHDDFSILTMVAADDEQGTGGTIGLQDDTSTVGITFSCDTAMGVVPGVTAVLYTLATPPDSDCCTESPTDTAGCVDPPCWAAVCEQSPSCCITDWDAACAATAQTQCEVLCGVPPAININEIRVDQLGGNDDDEYFELVGPPGTPLTDVQYIILGDAPTGEIEEVIDLTGNAIPPSGYFVVAESTFTLGTADYTSSINFEDDQTVTHLLVGGFSGVVLQNLDMDADGVLDSTPWDTVFDTVSLIDPSSALLPYGPGSSCMEGPLCQEVDDGIDGPSQVYRCVDGDGTWQIGNVDPLAMPATDTPGVLNDCSLIPGCGNGVVDPGEDCDDLGESATCDDDCTDAMCGDGLLNPTAGEECDDGNPDDGDGCAADCTEETEPGTTGDTGDTGGSSSGTTGDTGLDDTAGSTGSGTTGGGTTGDSATSTGPGPSTVPLTSGSGSSSGGGTEGDTSTLPDYESCACRTGDEGRGAPWSVLALLGLGALGRRRRRR